MKSASNARVLIVAIPAFFTCLTAVIVALANPDLIRTVAEVLKNTPTATSAAPAPDFSPTAPQPPAMTLPPEPTTAPTDSAQPACAWIPYLNGKALPAASSCLDDLIAYGIFQKNGNVVFAVDLGREVGTYGVCTNISSAESSKFRVELNDDIVSARFLVSISPQPIPVNSSYGVRIQPEISRYEREIYLKRIEYTANGYANEADIVEAIPEWHNLNVWDFDFEYQFTGPKVHALVNMVPVVEGYQPYGTRYLCFSYQSMPTSEKAAHLDVTVKFR
ncbi:MAG: hypothetical protein Fur0035_24970 [Anaerolineales bacterium]